MAFKKTQPLASAPDRPDQLFLDLPRRKYTGLLDHQGQILRSYFRDALENPDVALQLPTGSGKTLVGLLIAEWRRRKYRERTVYLCPTKQLVHQVAEEAHSKYGLEVDAFVGRVKDYDPSAKGRYANADRVAVTTYNALFNTNPYFDNSHVILVDDAHAAENYIAQLWTLIVDRTEPSHRSLFSAIASVLRPAIAPQYYSRLIDEPRLYADKLWVDKVPTPVLLDVIDELRDVIDAHAPALDLKYPWEMLSEHLSACHVYLSAMEIFIRPLIPPTWTHAAFTTPRQRIFMSATLGRGGDLERLTGRKSIKRLAIPEGWDKQGIGRRFFMFPGMSLSDELLPNLRARLMEISGRSLVLVRSDAARRAVEQEITDNLAIRTFSASDIETSKKPFTESERAVAIVANRYDGIDFPGDDCRLLFIEGLPRATNLQEQFLMARMGAAMLLNERVQTRILQAVGRCTRGLNDFSAVVVGGEELPDYLVNHERRAHLHPELQAEIEFGIEQSRDVTLDSFVENFSIFLEHDTEWEIVNQAILTKRALATQVEFPAMADLEAAVTHEIAYQERMWQGSFEDAFDQAREVLASLRDPELRGYRALWHYLAGAAALLSSRDGASGLDAQARGQFAQAKEAARGIPWLVTISRTDRSDSAAETKNATTMRQIERVEAALASLGNLHNRAFAKREKEILEGLANPDTFENAQRMLGEILGFVVGKVETDASPDPWWLADGLGLVFEDHAGASGPGSSIDATKARQTASHVDWMRVNVPAAQGANVISVLVTPATRMSLGALPSLQGVSLWKLEDFVSWARESMSSLRELRKTFVEPGDLVWRIKAAEVFELKRIDAPSLHAWLKGQIAAGLLIGP